MSEVIKPIATDETLQGVAKDTSLQAVAKTVSDNAAILLRMAEALDAKDTTQDRLSEINAAAEEKKQEVVNVGEQVKTTIPDDYSVLSEKVNNTSNALKGTASGEAVGITDVSPVEHNMGVKVRSKNVVSIADRTSNGEGSFSSQRIVVNLSPNAVYTASADFTQTGNNATVGITVRDANEKTIGKSDTTTDTNGRLSATFTVPADGKVSIVVFSNITSTAIAGASCTYSNIQIEEGITATPYTPFVADLSGVSVKKCGKNLIPYPYYEKTKTQNGLTFTDNGDGSVTVNGTATAETNFILRHSYNPISLIKGKTYTVSGKPNVEGVRLIVQDIRYRQSIEGTAAVSYDVGYYVFIRITSGTVCNNLVFKPQLEIGAIATEYEKYEETTYTPNADGVVEGVTSLYPVTTLMTDTAGVIVDAEYNRDINKAYEELVQAIISLGGNV